FPSASIASTAVTQPAETLPRSPSRSTPLSTFPRDLAMRSSMRRVLAARRAPSALSIRCSTCLNRCTRRRGNDWPMHSVRPSPPASTQRSPAKPWGGQGRVVVVEDGGIELVVLVEVDEDDVFATDVVEVEEDDAVVLVIDDVEVELDDELTVVLVDVLVVVPSTVVVVVEDVLELVDVLVEDEVL